MIFRCASVFYLVAHTFLKVPFSNETSEVEDKKPSWQGDVVGTHTLGFDWNYRRHIDLNSAGKISTVFTLCTVARRYWKWTTVSDLNLNELFTLNKLIAMESSLSLVWV